MYLTYQQYTEYGGTLKERDFDRFAFIAQKELDTATFNRLTTREPDDNVKRCMYNLVLYLSANENNGTTAPITSVSNDGYSVSYATEETAKQGVQAIIETYFANTDLMYCGSDKEIGYTFLPKSLLPEEGFEFLQVEKG